MAQPKVTYNNPTVNLDAEARRTQLSSERIAAARSAAGAADREGAVSATDLARAQQRANQAIAEATTLARAAAAVRQGDTAAIRGETAAINEQTTALERNARARSPLSMVRQQMGFSLTPAQLRVLQSFAETGVSNTRSRSPFDNLRALGLVEPFPKGAGPFGGAFRPTDVGRQTLAAAGITPQLSSGMAKAEAALARANVTLTQGREAAAAAESEARQAAQQLAAAAEVLRARLMAATGSVEGAFGQRALPVPGTTVGGTAYDRQQRQTEAAAANERRMAQDEIRRQAAAAASSREAAAREEMARTQSVFTRSRLPGSGMTAYESALGYRVEPRTRVSSQVAETGYSGSGYVRTGYNVYDPAGQMVGSSKKLVEAQAMVSRYEREAAVSAEQSAKSAQIRAEWDARDAEVTRKAPLMLGPGRTPPELGYGGPRPVAQGQDLELLQMRSSYWKRPFQPPYGYLGAGSGPLPPGGSYGYGSGGGWGGGMGGGPGAPPPPPPPPGGSGWDRFQKTDQFKTYTAATQAQAEAEAKLAGVEEHLKSVRMTAGSQMASLSTDTRRYGALTSEFFEAMGRGEVTLRELGYQMGITAAKFGGWTLAAGAIFGVVKLFQDMKEGAVDAQSGVETLSRFVEHLNKGQAVEGLTQTSQQFVEPIKNVAEAQNAFARVSHDQAGSLTAARVAILATKLDNVSLADSYKYLIATAQELHVPLSDLPGLFDQISAAQRNVGARVQETLPAMAKSLAAVRGAQGNEGGQRSARQDYSDLLALESLALVTTGQSGNLIGTTFARGAANFYNSSVPLRNVGMSPVDIQRRYGVDTTLPFLERLMQAIQIGSKLGPQAQLLLSQSFMGGQRGALLTGLFRQGAQLDTFKTKTSEAFASGSAMEEWNKQAGRADLQIKKLTIGLQALGAEAQKGGITKPLGGVLAFVNTTIAALDQSVRGFTQLPQAVSVGTESLILFLGAMKALTSFQGGVLMSKIPGLRRVFDDPEARTGRLGAMSLNQVTRGAQEYAAASASTASRLASAAAAGKEEARLTEIEAQAAKSRFDSMVAAGASEKQLAVASEEYEKSAAVSLEAATAAAALTDRAAQANLEAAAAKRGYREADVEQAMFQGMTPAQQAAYMRTSRGGEDPRFPRRVGHSSEPLATAEELGMTGVITDMQAAQAAAGKSFGMWQVASAKMTVGLKSLRSSYAAFRGTESVEAATMNMAATEQAAAAASVNLGTMAMTRINTGARWMSANLGKLAMGYLAFTFVLQQLDQDKKEYAAGQDKINELLGHVTGSWSQMAQDVAAARKKAVEQAKREAEGPFHGLPGFDVLARGFGEQPIFRAIPHMVGMEWQSEVDQQSTDRVQALEANYKKLTLKLDKDAQLVMSTGRGRDAWLNELAIVQQAVEQYSQGRTGSKEGKDAYKKAQQHLWVTYQAVQSYVQPTAIGTDPFEQFASQNLQENASMAQFIQSRAGVYGSSKQSIDQAVYLYQWVAKHFSGRGNDDQQSMSKIQQARDAMLGQVQTSVKQFTDAAQYATTPGEEQTDLKQAAGQVAQAEAAMKHGEDFFRKRVDDAAGAWMAAVVASGAWSKQAQAAWNLFQQRQGEFDNLLGADKITKQQLEQETKQANIQAQVDRIGSFGALRTAKIGGISPEADMARSRSDLRTLQDELGKVNAMNGSYKQKNDLKKQIADKQREIDKGEADQADQYIKDQYDLQKAQIMGTSPEAELARAQKQLQEDNAIAAQHQLEGRGKAQARTDAIQQANDRAAIYNQRVTMGRDLINAENQLAQSQISGQSPQAAEARLASQAQGLERLMAYDKQTHAGRAALISDQAQINSAWNSYADQVANDAEAQRQAYFTFLESTTTDPVQQARYQVQAAREAVDNASKVYGKNSQEYWAARASYNKAQQGVVATQVQDKEDTIDFRLQMQQISSQTAIQEYEALLHIHGITKQLRRQVLEKIQELKNSGQQDFAALDLGTIRLPTPYEIRRSVMQLRDQATATIVQQNTANIHVYDGRDANAVGVQLESFIGGTGKSLARAAGTRG